MPGPIKETIQFGSIQLNFLLAGGPPDMKKVLAIVQHHGPEPVLATK